MENQNIGVLKNYILYGKYKKEMGLFWWLCLGFLCYYIYLFLNGSFNFQDHSQTIYILIGIAIVGKLIF
jgi:hypothetical protein